MRYGIHGSPALFSLILVSFVNAFATTVPGVSFEELTDQSELIVAGQINRSWADWDSDHKYIWTHYELDVSSALKGNPGVTVVVSEPGGAVGLQEMTIAGAPVYKSGDQVLVFLQRMPNGYLRTTGWGQGKFAIDTAGRVHAGGLQNGIEMADVNGRAAPTRIRSLEGMRIEQIRQLVAARAQTGSQARAK
jgi:hypothetical protein